MGRGSTATSKKIVPKNGTRDTRASDGTRMTTRPIRVAWLTTSALPIRPALAADVTPERLANPDKEPQNWLMNHRSYDAQRFSPLTRINKDNVKSLKLAYAVALGGT